VIWGFVDSHFTRVAFSERVGQAHGCGDMMGIVVLVIVRAALISLAAPQRASERVSTGEHIVA